MTSQHDITRLIRDAQQGRHAALDTLMPLVHDELQSTARRHLRGERDGHTLDTSALVNETYLRLAEQDRTRWQNRMHFFAVASMVMRRVLVNYAKQHNRLKRGGGAIQVTLSEAHGVPAEQAGADVEALDAALNRLAEIDARSARVVECRYFGGLSIEETAEVLDIAPATVKRDWLLAKTWLRRELDQTDST